jgi:16S rRNA (cytosine967-C5)-methyltransferase
MPPTEREVSLNILLEITQKKAYNNIALQKALRDCVTWKPYQRAFVTELVKGTLRNLILINHIIDRFTEKPIYKTNPIVGLIVQTAVYQIHWMDKVPVSAAVNEAVKLVKKRGFPGADRFVNGVLRNIDRSINAIFSETLPFDIRYSIPPWLAGALTEWLGGIKQAEEFCLRTHATPPLTLVANTLKTTRSALSISFFDGAVNYTRSVRNDHCLYIKNSSDITVTEAYRQGLFHVMDESAYTAAVAADVKPGQFVIDLCAAPGGKSFVCAAMMQNRGTVHACDIHPHKIKIVQDGAKRLGVTCMVTHINDAAVTRPAWVGKADAVLLDAPCSGFGTLRRKPDIKYNKTLEDVRRLALIQRELLTAAAAYVKTGGTLLYSTCTVSQEENGDNAQWFIKNHPFALAEAKQILPDDTGDGMYYAKFIRL